MIFNEAEDFEIYDGCRWRGRFMVASTEPYELDIEAELKKDDMMVHMTIDRLLSEGIIEHYYPNYHVSVGLFGDIDIKKADYLED